MTTLHVKCRKHSLSTVPVRAPWIGLHVGSAWGYTWKFESILLNHYHSLSIMLMTIYFECDVRNDVVVTYISLLHYPICIVQRATPLVHLCLQTCHVAVSDTTGCPMLTPLVSQTCDIIHLTCSCIDFPCIFNHVGVSVHRVGSFHNALCQCYQFD